MRYIGSLGSLYEASPILRLELSILVWVPSPCVVKNNLELLTLLAPIKVTGYNIPGICHQASAYVGLEPRALRCLASTLSVELCAAEPPFPPYINVYQRTVQVKA